MQRKSQTNLISPPPEFSNQKLLQIQEHYSTVNSNNNNNTSRTSSTPSYEEIRVPSRSSSREATLRHQSQYSTSPYSPQQPEVPQRISSVARSGSYTPNQPKQLRVVENYTTNSNYATTREVKSYGNRETTASRSRSPLTLSIDSGISSGVNANRKQTNRMIEIKKKFHLFIFAFTGRHQATSVSPRSASNQSSPQGEFNSLPNHFSQQLKNELLNSRSSSRTR